ncbi:hypothetical protein GCM10027047_14410 [Rhodococcus aerolatus]
MLGAHARLRVRAHVATGTIHALVDAHVLPGPEVRASVGGRQHTGRRWSGTSRVGRVADLLAQQRHHDQGHRQKDLPDTAAHDAAGGRKERHGTR